MFDKGMRLIKHLESLGGEAYIVGGAVRDLLLGIKPSDVDICTNVPMETIEASFQTHDIGANKMFGILVVIFEDEMFEVAQFRTETSYSDGRRPDEVKIVKTLAEDLSRRDFTINAMAIGTDGKIVDMFNGLGHLQSEMLMRVGDGGERQREDKLRSVRALRFVARTGFIMPGGVSRDLRGVSNERLVDEIRKTAGYGTRKLTSFIKMCYENSMSMPINCQPFKRNSMLSRVDIANKEINIALMLIDTMPAEKFQDHCQIAGFSRKEINLATYLNKYGRLSSGWIIDQLTNAETREMINDPRFTHLTTFWQNVDDHSKNRLAIKDKISIIENVSSLVGKKINGLKVMQHAEGISGPEVGVVLEQVKRMVWNRLGDISDEEVLILIKHYHETLLSSAISA